MRVRRAGRWLAGAIVLLIPLASARPSRPAAPTSPAPSSPASISDFDTSAVALPASYPGQEFLRVMDALAGAQPASGADESADALRDRVAATPQLRSWLFFRLDERVSLETSPDSQRVTCRLDLKQAQDSGLRGAKAIVLHTQIWRGPTFAAHDARGSITGINSGRRDVQGLLLVTREGDVARAPAAYERTVSIRRTPGAPAGALRAFAVCRATPLRADHRTLLDVSSYTEPSVGMPVRLQNRFRYLCAYVVSIWLVDGATGAVVSKEPFEGAE